MFARFTRKAALTAALLIGGTTLAACGANDAQSGGEDGEEGGGDKTIALLLPETSTTRYETFDRPLFEAAVAELCSDCVIDYQNADQNAETQAQQMSTATSEGASVIVLDPVDGAAIGGAVTEAQSAGATVIAYDRFIAEADYYMSFDNQTVGELQGQALVDAMGDTGNILMLNGAPNDPNAGQFKEGAHSVIDASGVTILEEFDNPDWSPENAQEWTTDQLAKHDPAEIQGVYAANDGQAGGVVAAFAGQGVSGDTLPPLTGQDAEVEAIQRIIAGEQEMTVYKPIPIEAETAAEVAVKLVNGEEVEGTSDTGVELTEYEGVQSYIFDPIVVTAENANVVVEDGFYEASEICTPDYAEACATAGIE